MYTIAAMQPEDVRAEYGALVSYGISSVSSRFTVAGLYMAASGFLAAAAFKDGLSTAARIVVCLFGGSITLCVWMLELRTRHLLAILSKRGRDIERDIWGLTGTAYYSGFFSRQGKIPPKVAPEHGKEHDYTILGYSSRGLPRWVAVRITHSFGFDLMYLSGIVFRTVVLIASCIQRKW